jgi:hypothetical protein
VHWLADALLSERRLKAEERLKEEASPGAAKLWCFVCFVCFAQSIVRFSILNSDAAQLWVGWFWLGMQSCAQFKTEVASKEVSVAVRCGSSHGNKEVVYAGSKER